MTVGQPQLLEPVGDDRDIRGVAADAAGEFVHRHRLVEQQKGARHRGTAFGWRPAGGLGSAILAVGLALLFGYAFSWVMAAIGLATKTPEAAEAAGFLPLFPLVFASSAFLPTATMPGWLEAFANVQPISIVANAVRALTIDEGARVALGLADPASLVVQALLWIVGIVVVCGPLAVRLYRRISG